MTPNYVWRCQGGPQNNGKGKGKEEAPPLSTDLSAGSAEHNSEDQKPTLTPKGESKHAQSPTTFQLISLDIWLGKCFNFGIRSPYLVAMEKSHL